MTDIEAIQAREQAATPGPWVAEFIGHKGYPVSAQHANAKFIAAARTDIPDLLAAFHAERAAHAEALKTIVATTAPPSCTRRPPTGVWSCAIPVAWPRFSMRTPHRRPAMAEPLTRYDPEDGFAEVRLQLMDPDPITVEICKVADVWITNMRTVGQIPGAEQRIWADVDPWAETDTPVEILGGDQ